MSGIFSSMALAVLYLLNKLPLRVLYLFSDFIYLIVYYIVGYRRKLVRRSLRNSFPEKSDKERKKIEKEFYSNLCDYFVETIKYYGMSHEAVAKHIEFRGLDSLQKAIDNGRSCVCYMLHAFNWEYVTSLPLFFNGENLSVGAVYHKLRNPHFDKVFKDMRAQYGADNVSMKNTLRHIIEITKNNKLFVYGFMADQLPKVEAMNHWLTFLNQDTAVFTGAEKIARRTRASVFNLELVKVARGKYVATFELLYEDASLCKENEITDKYFAMGEEYIRKYPAMWLWTHNRWKRGRASREAFEKHIADRKRELGER